MTDKVIAIGMLWILMLSGCPPIHREKIPADRSFPELKWNLENYAEFVKENMAQINARYTDEYERYEFVVDTDYGSTIIQNLIDTEAAAAITAAMEADSDPNGSGHFTTIYQYIIAEFDYVLDPNA
jgi:hypothetical protein